MDYIRSTLLVDMRRLTYAAIILLAMLLLLIVTATSTALVWTAAADAAASNSNFCVDFVQSNLTLNSPNVKQQTTSEKQSAKT